MLITKPAVQVMLMCLRGCIREMSVHQPLKTFCCRCRHAVCPAANTKLTAGQQLTVMGWGATSEGGSQSSALMTVDIPTTDLQTCRGAFQSNQISGDTQVGVVTLSVRSPGCADLGGVRQFWPSPQ